MRIRVKTLFLHGGAVTEVLEIQVPRHVVCIKRIRNEFLRQHLHILHGVFNTVDICFITCDKANLSTASIRQFLNRDNTGHCSQTVCRFLKIIIHL